MISSALPRSELEVLLIPRSSTIREVVLVPNRQWGGEGLLGCVFGLVRSLAFASPVPHSECSYSFGLLHRIPPSPADREPGTVPPELRENSDEFEDQQLFVPADLSQQTTDNE